MPQSTNKSDKNANVLPLDAAVRNETDTATFALGCFWSPDARFGCVPGVVRTRVGYAGGTKENPTYRDLGDHVETIQIDYDPTQISYGDLLEIFWKTHNPETPSYKRQYMSAVFYNSEEQKRLAQETKEREARHKGQIHTEIAFLSTFYWAEDYHQKYHLRGDRDLMSEFKAIYDNAEFVNSTVAARVNGYLTGYGNFSQLQNEIDEFGLSDRALKKLENIVSRRSR